MGSRPTSPTSFRAGSFATTSPRGSSKAISRWHRSRRQRHADASFRRARKTPRRSPKRPRRPRRTARTAAAGDSRRRDPVAGLPAVFLRPANVPPAQRQARRRGSGIGNVLLWSALSCRDPQRPWRRSGAAVEAAALAAAGRWLRRLRRRHVGRRRRFGGLVRSGILAKPNTRRVTRSPRPRPIPPARSSPWSPTDPTATPTSRWSGRR